MKRFFPLLLLVLPALSRAAEAPGPPPPPADLGALLREAETHSPEIRAAAARLEVAHRGPSQAQAPPDPEISISYLNDGVSQFTLGESEFSYLGFTWTQEFLHPGKLDSSAEVAALDAEIVDKALEGARLKVAADVKTAYAQLYRLDRTSTVLQEARSVLETLVQAARKRYEIGEGIQESVLKAQTEILRLEVEMARVLQERRVQALRLNAAVGRLGDVPLGLAGNLPAVVVPEDPEPLADAALVASPEVGGLESSVKSGEAGVKLARLNLKPDFIWSASYQNRDGLDPMVMGMFGVRLPLHRDKKQAQALSQKESQLLVARHELDSVRVRTRAAVRELISTAQTADRIAMLMDQGVIPQARSALESAQVSYGVGRIAFLDVLNDLSALLNARIELANQEADRFRALAALEPLLARELIQVPEGRREADGKEGHDADSR